MTSASATSSVGRIPCCMSWPASRWLSSSFIWQPQVSMKKRRSCGAASVGPAPVAARSGSAIGLDRLPDQLAALDRLVAMASRRRVVRTLGGLELHPFAQPAGQRSRLPPLFQGRLELVLELPGAAPRVLQALQRVVPGGLDLAVAHVGAGGGVEAGAQLRGALLQLEERGHRGGPLLSAAAPA